jgi:hypothetical protein
MEFSTNQYESLYELQEIIKDKGKHRIINGILSIGEEKDEFEREKIQQLSLTALNKKKLNELYLDPDLVNLLVKDLY